MKVLLTDYGIRVTEREPSLVSGSSLVYTCQVEVDPDAGAGWSGFSRTLVFRNAASGKEVEVTPGPDGTAKVPWETLADPGALLVGCYGTDSHGARRVTQLAEAGTVSKGCYGMAAQGTSPTPTPFDQLSASIEEIRGELEKKQDATGVYLQIGKDSDGNATPQVVVERGA